MKTLLTLLTLAVTLSAAPTRVDAVLTGIGTPLSDGATYIGPYTLSINGQEVAGMCIDPFHSVAVGNGWTANITDLTDLSSTYSPEGLLKYQVGAWLYSEIIKPDADRIGLQHAAWALAGGQQYVSQETLAILRQGMEAAPNINPYAYSVVTDIAGNKQEFIVASPVPEPGPTALVGLGMVAVGWLTRRRKKFCPLRYLQGCLKTKH